MIPASVQSLLDRIVEGLRRVLGENVVGVYLHGSLTIGGFNLRTSDIDFLVVVEMPLTRQIKQALVDLTFVVAQDAPEKGLEFSVVLRQHTQHFSYPTPFEFHYSRDWHRRYEIGDIDMDTPRQDPDLAAHFVITRTCGHCLYGLPIETAFGAVPESAYWASILADAEAILDDILINPVYSVLNLCRVIAYQREKLILSKVGAGTWALRQLPVQFHPLIRQALERVQSAAVISPHWEADAMAQFGSYARNLLFE